MRRTVRAPFLLGLLLAAPSAAQQDQAPYVEKVEVRVRSVLVFITDAKGKPLASPPSPSDLRVTESGAPVEVLAVEPARGLREPAKPSGETAAPAAPPASRPAEPLAQYLYLDTTALQARSVPRIVKTVESNLDAMLASGPIEIVVADPEPAVVQASTADAAAIRSALATLPRRAIGKDRLVDVRRQTMTQMMDTQTAETFRVDVRAAVREELALVRGSLERLQRWASTLPGDRAAILYLCSDGFDLDPSEAYRAVLITGGPEDVRLAQQLQLEFGREVPQLVQQAASVLAGRGLTAMMLAFGGSSVDFAQSAANLHKMTSGAIRRPLGGAPVSYYARPFEPLVTVADATGGQVVSATTRLPKALDEIGGAYLVSFRSRAPSDGQPHPLEVASASGNLKVRAPHSVLAGTPAAASASKAERALSAPPPAGSLPVTASVSVLEELENGRTKGQLLVSADLETIAAALETLGPGRVRVTVAVENNKGAPFTQSQEMDLDNSGEGTFWYYESAIVWPPDATRVAVTVEELKTGASGSAVAALAKE